MNSNSEEDRFRGLFDELRQTDHQLTPSFEQDWPGTGSKTQSILHQIRYGRLVGALLLVVVVVGFARHDWSVNPSIALRPPLQTMNPDSGNTQMPLSLDNWQSPTAFLLQDTDEWGLTLDSTEEPSMLAPSTQPQPRHST